MADGTFVEIDRETALGEIAERLGDIRRMTGRETIALVKGTRSYKSVAAMRCSMPSSRRLDRRGFSRRSQSTSR
jgi:hypothetical protein